MNVDYSETEGMVRALARQAGLTVADRALVPLKRIDFRALVGIYDHEEAFLKDVFLSSLAEAKAARAQTDGEDGLITVEDMRAALLMLGAAAANAGEQTFSGRSKTRIRDICPYCVSAASASEGEEVYAE